MRSLETPLSSDACEAPDRHFRRLIKIATISFRESTDDEHRTASATMTANAAADAKTFAAALGIDEDAQVQHAKPARSARARVGWAFLLAVAYVGG